MEKIRFFTAFVCGLFLCTGLTYAQNETKKMTLPQLLTLADENNRSILASQTQVKIAQESARESRNSMLPSIGTTLSLSYNGNGTITDRDFTNAFQAEIPHFGNNFIFEASMVLYAGGVIKNGVKINDLQAQMALLSAEGTREDVHFLLIGYYLELCKCEHSLSVLNAHIAQTEKALEHMRSRFAEGTALSNDITRFELQLQQLHTQKTQLTNYRSILNNQLTVATGLDAATVLVTDDSLFDHIMNPLQVEEWKNKALENATALKKAQVGLEMSRQGEKIALGSRMPQIALIAVDQLNGPVTIEIPALDKNFNYWYVGVGLKYNIDNLYKSNKTVSKSRLQAQHAMEQLEIGRENIALAVDNAFIKYRESFILHQTQEQSAALALDNFQVVNHRYENGLCLITELLDATSQKLDADLNVISAKINILYQFYQLNHLCGTL